MMKLALTLCVAITLTACGGGKVKSYEHNQAMNTLDVALNQLLSGNDNASLSAYKRTLDNFLKSADFCNMSRAGILLFFVGKDKHNNLFLTDAIKYAKLGSCESEINITNFLTSMLDNDSDPKFDLEKLEEPYKTYYLFLKEKKAEYIVKYISRNDISDAVRTFLLRAVAEFYRTDNDYVNAEKYINYAIKIDKAHSWRGNILDNYNILKNIYDSAGKDSSAIDETINLLSGK